jgi:phosphomevalonate kinase
MTALHTNLPAANHQGAARNILARLEENRVNDGHSSATLDLSLKTDLEEAVAALLGRAEARSRRAHRLSTAMKQEREVLRLLDEAQVLDEQADAMALVEGAGASETAELLFKAENAYREALAAAKKAVSISRQ